MLEKQGKILFDFTAIPSTGRVGKGMMCRSFMSIRGGQDKRWGALLMHNDRAIDLLPRPPAPGRGTPRFRRIVNTCVATILGGNNFVQHEEQADSSATLCAILQVTETPQRFTPRATRSSTGSEGSVWSKAATITNCGGGGGGGGYHRGKKRGGSAVVRRRSERRSQRKRVCGRRGKERVREREAGTKRAGKHAKRQGLVMVETHRKRKSACVMRHRAR